MLKDGQEWNAKQQTTNYIHLFYAQGSKQSWNAKQEIMSNNHHDFQIDACNQIWIAEVEILSRELSKHAMLILRSRL